MLEEALRYPLASEDRVSTLLIGGVLLAVPFFASLLSLVFLPLALVAVLVTLPFSLVVQGYLLRVLRSAASDETAAPSFTNWGSLLVDGLKLLVVNLVYGLVVIVPTIGFLFVAGVGAGLLSNAGESASVAALSTITLVVLLVVTLFSLLLAYLLPAALTNLALRERLGAAFDFGTIRQVIFTSEYLVGVVLGVVLAGVIGTFASLSLILLVGIPLLFYAQVVSYYCFGRGFAAARESMAPATETV